MCDPDMLRRTALSTTKRSEQACTIARGGDPSAFSEVDSVSLPPITERRYQLRIVQYAVQAGWDVWHDSATNTASSCFTCARANLPAHFACPTCKRPITVMRNPPGKLDLELLRPPRVIFAEVKAAGGRLTVEQAARIARLRACPGVEVYTWWPQDWPDVVRILARPDWDLNLIIPQRVGEQGPL